MDCSKPGLRIDHLGSSESIAMISAQWKRIDNLEPTYKTDDGALGDIEQSDAEDLDDSNVRTRFQMARTLTLDQSSCETD